jgi:mannose-6-phosphate isomerase-like protein (cupin superfamily)
MDLNTCEEDATMDQEIDFAEVFSRLAREESREETTPLGGVNVRLVRVAGGGEGRWDSHAQTAETVVVWSGDFTVEFRDHTLHLSSGQCCVVPAGVEHRGTSKGGAEIVLFQQVH